MLKWPLFSSDNYHLKNFINKIVFWLHHCMKKSWLLKQHHQINLVRITNCNIIYMVHLLSLITGDHTKCHLDLSNQTPCILVQLSNSNWVYTLNWTNNITIPVGTTWVISVWSVYMIIVKLRCLELGSVEYHGWFELIWKSPLFSLHI